jgi:hypothetical protein
MILGEQCVNLWKPLKDTITVELNLDYMNIMRDWVLESLSNLSMILFNSFIAKAFGPISLPDIDPVNNLSRTFMLNGSGPAK